MATNEELVQLIQSGIDTQKNIEALWLQNTGIVHKIAAGYALDAVELEDLAQEGYFALVKAAEGYDPERGAAFVSYLAIHLHGQLRRYLAKSRASVSLGIHMTDEVIRYRRIMMESQRDGAELDDDEICCRMHVSKRRLETIKSASGAADVLSLDHTQFYEQLSASENAIEDLETEIVSRQLSEKLWSMVEGLDVAERELIKGMFLRDKTGTEMAAELGVNYNRIRKLKRDAFDKLKRNPDSKALLDMAREVYALALRGTGLRVFERTWTSATERAALIMIERGEK